MKKMKNFKKGFLGLFFLASTLYPLPSTLLYAAFEDIGLGAGSRGLADSVTALGDINGVLLNPAVTGGARKFETGVHFEAGSRTSLGPADFNSYAFNMALPRMTYGKLGTLSLLGRYNSQEELSQKTLGIGYGTWQALKTALGVVDFGAGLKVLQAAAVKSGDSGMGFGLDLGALWRADSRHNLGLSFLNVNSPSFKIDAADDRAPFTVRFGAAETTEDYTLTMDVARRAAAGGYPANFSLNSGFEYVWRTYRYGLFCSRTGLSLAGRASFLSLGIAYKHLASELAYSLMAPLTGAILPGHALSLTVRFGDRDIESEYERLIKQEIKYRKDLIGALDESLKRETLLKDELNSLKVEIDALNDKLNAAREQKAAVVEAREKLEVIVERQRRAEAELKVLEEKRRRDKLNQVQFDFSRDWQAYLKLKSGGAPKDVLKGSLQRLISQYQSTGIDISQATIELQQLVQ
ncbi:MAG: conjugal transfer protein TraF [Elusimicrobia bacterium]|nr:conjugal transfer protein TraF [Elusimicrobiota bacterium]